MRRPRRPSTENWPSRSPKGYWHRSLKPLWRAYAILTKGRDARGPLELDLPERKLILDAHGLIERVVTPLRLDAHRLIEEFMIQANVAAAEELEARKHPCSTASMNSHRKKKIRSLAEFLKTVDMMMPIGQVIRPKHFNKLLER